MGHKSNLGRLSQKVSLGMRAVIAGGVAAVAVAGALAAGVPAASAATTPLPVTLSADGNGSAVFSAHGVPLLNRGSTGTYAQLAVNLKALGQNLAPKTPPSFTTDNYAAGSPRWVIALANGRYLFGYPAQLGAGANASFTGNQWEANGVNVYETYAKALADANDPLGNVAVTDAYIVQDADQAAGTVDTLTNVQYGGAVVGGGTVTISPVAAQTVTAGTTPPALRLTASTTSSDQALTFFAKGLPKGLSVNAATGVISGTVAKDALSGTAVVTAQDAYGTVDATAIVYTVKPVTPPPPPPPTVVRLSNGHVVPGTLLPTRAVVAWKATPAAPGGYRVTINGPNFNYRTGYVTVTVAYYRGLAAGHTYAVYVTPLDAHGKPIGATGHVTFVTPR